MSRFLGVRVRVLFYRLGTQVWLTARRRAALHLCRLRYVACEGRQVVMLAVRLVRLVLSGLLMVRSVEAQLSGSSLAAALYVNSAAVIP